MTLKDMAPHTSEEISSAVQQRLPVVALESTLIAHGLPWPDNLQLAQDVEEIVRAEGAVPATIGIINGTVKVGLSLSDLELMAREQMVVKVSRRDLAVVHAKGLHGATTVAATLHLAVQTDIRVMATGGIGGVHREARDTWDVSADLAVLGEAPVAVAASGVKSILDIPATLEYLETQSVPVVGYQTHRFPGFYLRDSGQPVDWRVDSPEEIAAIYWSQRALGTRAALLVANPVPSKAALDPEVHNRSLDEALRLAKETGVAGRSVTPFLLKKLRELSDGEALSANVALIRANARLAAQIAVSLEAADEGTGKGNQQGPGRTRAGDDPED